MEKSATSIAEEKRPGDDKQLSQNFSPSTGYF